MRRHPDWPERLDAFLKAASGRPFSWGTNDCCLFACDAVAAMTGTDPAAPVRGRYRSRAGALHALRLYAGGAIAETAEKIAAELGCAEVPPLGAQRGDVVLTDQEWWPALGVCCGATIALTGLHGIERQPLRRVVRAWRIG